MPISPELPSPDSQEEWYGAPEQPIYARGVGADALTDAEELELVQLARRFVSHWVEYDNHGLRIPASDWGGDLLWALRKLLSATNPLLSTVSFYAWGGPYETPPWFVIHTDNQEWVDALPHVMEVETPAGKSSFTVFIRGNVTTEDASALDHDGWETYPEEVVGYSHPRFAGTVTGRTAEELTALVTARLKTLPPTPES